MLFLVHMSIQHSQLSKKMIGYLTKFANILLTWLFLKTQFKWPKEFSATKLIKNPQQ